MSNTIYEAYFPWSLIIALAVLCAPAIFALYQIHKVLKKEK